MSEKKIMLTYEGLKELEGELAFLKTTKRKEIAEKIKDARSQGDLSENAEYDAAKEEQARVEARIAVLDKMLRNAAIIDEDDLDTNTIRLGSKVLLHDEEFDEDIEYAIVGSAEANPVAGRISNESPLGTVLLGKQSGETVEVSAPDGIIKFRIVSIA